MNDCVEDILNAEVRVPQSTYRVQMHKGFTFEDATDILAYLKELGIGDFYSSPIFEARPGSMHGYDVTNHGRLNPELGGSEGFEKFSAALKQAGMGLLLDIVPNHMGVGNDTKWWQDVLENGHASEYADYFDIDWDPLKPELKNKLLLPILGGQYGDELEAKHIQVVIEGGKPYVQVFDHRMPVAPRTISMIFFRSAIGSVPPWGEGADAMPEELYELLRGLAHIPPHESTDPGLRSQRHDQLAELLPQLYRLLDTAELKPLVERALEKINGVGGQMSSFDALHELLEVQPYRLALWRTSGEEINYRRFFDVNDLVGLRMENGKVFAATHCLIRKMLADKCVTGLRIDHCDGLYDPEGYLVDLQRLYLASQCEGAEVKGEVDETGIEREVVDALKGYDWQATKGPLYVVVEKILEPGEYMPTKWAVHGTSGYDFVYFGNSIFIQGANEAKFDEIYARAISDKGGSKGGHGTDPAEIVYRSKLQVMQNSLASEVRVLANMLSHVASADRHARDFTDNILETAIREVIACFPVYRTYIDESGEYAAHDARFIQDAIRDAKRRNPDVDASAFNFLRDILFLSKRGANSPEARAEQLRFALKFQQLTGPVMAKGVEDTTFYVYNRFISANEVGGSAESFGISLDLLHKSNQERLKSSPSTMLTTSTHDTKRSEDVRNRLNVLSEMPEVWSRYVNKWQRQNGKYKRTLQDGRVAPDGNEEYLLYQTIAGAWPWEATEEAQRDYLERLKQYSTKALSEAKVNLSWLNPDQEYVDAVHGFLTDILSPDAKGKPTAFAKSLAELLPELRLFGAVNSIAQVVLKTMSPGVPDFYQGSESWDLSLVDPDNRRPVDYAERRNFLTAMQAQAAEPGGALGVAKSVTSELTDGRIKLWTTHRALQLRQQQAALFRHGDYKAVYASGDRKENLIGYTRTSSDGLQAVVTLLPRFSSSLMKRRPKLPLGDAWGDTFVEVPDLAGRQLRNVFTDEVLTVGDDGRLRLREAFAEFPVGLFTAVP
jgi:(1->4)-alpha-D-glucan 1-alpha-D-glucosylmutase